MSFFADTINRITKWNFDRKVKWVVTLFLTVSLLIILLACSWSYENIISAQMKTILEEQNIRIASDFETTLESYHALAYNVVLDDTVQEYTNSGETEPGGYINSVNEVRNTLTTLLAINSNLNFIALANNESGSYLYRGITSEISARFSERYHEDYETAIEINKNGMRISFNNVYSQEDNAINVYFPIYDTKYIRKYKGLLCMNFSGGSLGQITAYGSDDASGDVMVVYSDGTTLLSSTSTDKFDMKNITSSSGQYLEGRRQFFYRKLDSWPFYVVSSISSDIVYEQSVRVGIIMLFVFLFVLLIAQYGIGKMVKKLYSPLGNVVSSMEAVSAGSLNTRIDESKAGEDFATLTRGFNSMMETIDTLLEKVKMEEREMAQIRFNMLQSQIQPHFLYNTLDCIHWQAEADGNKKISNLVKSLAKYYRICLSSGKELIPLSEEIESIRCYLSIQNMRYGNIIENEMTIDEDLLKIQIPKLTLQPLIENSIYHGIKVKNGMHGKVSIIAKRAEEDVIIVISDTGTGMTEEDVKNINESLKNCNESFGYGVRNVNRRMELLYGSQYGLHYIYTASGGATVTVKLPVSFDNPGGE